MNQQSQWNLSISSAKNEADIVRAMSEYTATLLPSELQYLPEECRVASLRTGDDVGATAVALVQCELRNRVADEDAARLLREMADSFIAAQLRLRQIRARYSDPSPA